MVSGEILCVICMVVLAFAAWFAEMIS